MGFLSLAFDMGHFQFIKKLNHFFSKLTFRNKISNCIKLSDIEVMLQTYHVHEKINPCSGPGVVSPCQEIYGWVSNSHIGRPKVFNDIRGVGGNNNNNPTDDPWCAYLEIIA